MGAQALPQLSALELLEQLQAVPMLVQKMGELEAKVIELQADPSQGKGFTVPAAARYLGSSEKTVRKYMELDLLHPQRLHFNPGQSARGDRIPFNELKDWQSRTSTRRMAEQMQELTEQQENKGGFSRKKK